MRHIHGSLRALAGALVLMLWAAPALTAGGDAGDAYGKSAIPIVGYDDKSGWLYGAAGFLYGEKEPSVNAGLFIVSNLGNFTSTTLNIERRANGPWSYSLHLLAERAFDWYYGEGDLTPVQNPRTIYMDHFEAKPVLYYRLGQHLHVGPYIDFRARVETGSQLFPNEASAGFGLAAQWDTRDKLINPRRGAYFQLSADRDPAMGGFNQANLDLRYFHPLRPGLILASRLASGYSSGQPSYLFRYQLGGLDYLRGYKNNRFRGVDFIATEEELRWYLLKWLSANVSVDAGGIRDDAYHQLKLTEQVGLRIGLPPDWGQKMRVDFGFGADQDTIQVQFGEVF